MPKTYYFIDDSYFSSNGCDCCEPDYMPCYNIDTEEHPDFDLTLGSAHSEEGMMEQIMIHEGLLDPQWYLDCESDEGLDEYVRDMFRRYGFKIIIENDR